MKSNKGYVFFDEERNCWYARITSTDKNGKRRDIKRKVQNKTEGNELLKGIVRTYDDSGIKGISAENVTFANLADYFEKFTADPLSILTT